MSGASVAKPAVLGATESDFCGGASNALIFSSTGNTNFAAVSCAPPASTGVTNANGSNVFTIYYRSEGGSVIGALPLVTGSAIQQLNLNGASCNANICTVAVGGFGATNGTTDTFTGTTPHQSGLGLTDVEPGAFVGGNYPSEYSVSVFGAASPSQLASLTQVSVFQQVYGIFVNKTGLNTPICLSSEAVQGLLNNSITDWSKIEGCATHALIASSSTSVTLVNLVPGAERRRRSIG